MILIPEIETVVILVPRTGTTALWHAIKAAHPKAVMLYRHMEADGVPHGYDRWPKLGVVRDPLDRLWSLYKYLKDLDGAYSPAYIAAMRASVQGRDFSDWLLNNEIPFTTPYDSGHRGKFFPRYTVLHSMPENRKSQFVYLRPDLGTRAFSFPDELPELADTLQVKYPEAMNASTEGERPSLTPEALEYAEQLFAWDFHAVRGYE